MAWELDPDSFKRAVEDLWLGLNPEVRKGVSGYSIDLEDAPRDPRSAPLVVLEKDENGETATLVVKFLVIEGSLKADPELSWRPELARAMRRAAFAWTRTKSAPPSPAKGTASRNSSGEEEESATQHPSDAVSSELDRAPDDAEPCFEDISPAVLPEESRHEGDSGGFDSPSQQVHWNPPAKKAAPGIHLDEVRTLWFGLDERVRSAFGTLRLDEGEGPVRDAGEGLVSVDHGTNRASPTLVVYLGTLKTRLAAEPGLAWRPHLARAIKHALMEHQRNNAERKSATAPPCREPVPTPSPRVKQLNNDEQSASPREALNYGNPQASAGRWTTPARSSRPAPQKVVDVPQTTPRPAAPPTWATTSTAGRASVTPTPGEEEQEASAQTTLPSWLQWAIDLVLGPARGAFRPQDAKGGAAQAKLWAWRIGIISCYGASVLGLLFLAWSVVAGWREAASLAGEPGTESGVESGPDGEILIGGGQPLQEVQLDGRDWLIPNGWQLEGESGEGNAVFRGPARARIELIPWPADQDRGEMALARGCAAGHRSRVALGGNGLRYVDARFDDGGEVWQARCLFGEDVLVRALAPLTVFMGANLGDWVLLAALDVQWASQGAEGLER